MTLTESILTLESRREYLEEKHPTGYVRAEIAALDMVLGIAADEQYGRRCTRAARHAINLLLPGASC